MSVMFDLDAIAKILAEPPVHTWKGTCELCRNRRKLSDVGGVYCCDLCRNTIARHIKEHNHPFTEVVATMDPRYMGSGIVGARTPLPSATSGPNAGLADALKAYYSKELLRNLRGEVSKLESLVKPNY